MHRATLVVLAMGFGCLSTMARAEEEHRQLGPHVHGHGKLNIAIQGNKLEMELEAPGMDIVGFEHDAGNDEQKALVEAARKDLGDGILKLLVLPSGAGCKLVASNVAVVAEEHHDEGDEHEHEGASRSADAADQGTEHEHHHNEFHASYQLECGAPAKLTSISFPFFARFAGSQELDVAVIDDKGQNAYEVKRAAPNLELTR